MLDLVVLLFWLNWAAPAPPPAPPAAPPAVATLDPNRKLSKAEVELGKALRQLGKDLHDGNFQKIQNENTLENLRDGSGQ